MQSISLSKIWVIIPGYNESKNIAQVLTGVLKHTKNVVYVDDGSSDDSAKIAIRLIPNVLIHKINLGKGAALKTGCDYVFNEKNGAAVVFLDADNQHSPDDLPLFFNELRFGHKAVFGIRELDMEMPKRRRAASILSSVLINILFGIYVPDIMSGYKAISKDVYKKIYWNTRRYAVETELVIRMIKQKITFKKIRVETIYNNFNQGMTLLDIPNVILNIILLRLTI